MIVIYCPIYRQFFYIFFLTLQKVKVLFWSLQYFMNLLSIQALLFLLLAFSFFFNAALNPKIDCLTNCDNIHISIEEFSYHYYNRIDFFFWLYWRCYSTVYHVTQNCFQKITSLKSVLSLKTVNKQLDVPISALRLGYTGQSRYEIRYIQLFVYHL